MINLPQALVNEVRQGRAVLFLGAGATKGAKTPNGEEPPLGNELGERIGKTFLSGNYSTENLAWISELAISATDLFKVQDFIAQQFRDLMPADYHLLIPTFHWRGLVTTNYDRVIEVAYTQSHDAVQKIVPFLSNSDKVDEKLRDPSCVGLLKLHGCITRTNDEQLPLILTTDQYVMYRKGRDRLFTMLEEWGSENSIIFVGHNLQDPNLRGILLDLCQRLPSRPKYYLVRPGVSDLERDLWNAKRITTIDCTFKDFLKALDISIVKEMRPLAAILTTDHPISLRFTVTNKPSSRLIEFLTKDYEYVHEDVHIEEGSPSRFYSGFGLGWYPILMGLDVRRDLTNKLIEDVILRTEEDRPSQVEIYVIKAEAGAGKSVFLRRLAWEAATKAGALCLYRFRTSTPPSLEALRELSEVTNDRIFLFIDNAADNLQTIRGLIEFSRSRKLRITLITTERVNEWNIHCEFLDEFLSDQYKLSYLSRSEIETLIHLLAKNKALGPNLTGRTFEEQVKEFEGRAGRQLLVALHEATQGRPFEEILIDEYKSIIPSEAQRLYLTVCVLNRLKVSVRAGLISRIHEIPFEAFRERLFKPLEHVVNAIPLPWGDFAYHARHSEIAKIVFEQVLTDSIERFNEYIRVISALNPIYSIDYEALRGMLRAREIHYLFPSYEDAKAIYDAAEKIIGDNAYFFQQRANYERIRPNGNLSLAQALLNKARQLEPSDLTIIHTLAEVLLARAEKSDKKLERSKFRNEARVLLQTITTKEVTDSHATVTNLKIHINEVRDTLSDQSSTNREIDGVIRNAARAFESAKQNYPGDKFVLLAESELAHLLSDDNRSFEALTQARISNPRDPFITSRLATILVNRNDSPTARKYIEEALESNRGDKRLNYLLAELDRETGEVTPEGLTYSYRKAFTKWDTNYSSQFWYARFAFESNDPLKVQESKEVFKHLRNVPIRHENRILIRDAIGGLDNPKQYSGTIKRLEATHGFISVDGRGDMIFFHETDLDADVWEHLTSETRVAFFIGFNFRGPKALNVRLEGQAP